MPFFEELKDAIESEETRTVGRSFGGTGPSASFSVPKLRDWFVGRVGQDDNPCRQPYGRIFEIAGKKTTLGIVASLLRFSFLIELTDLNVGSTKMKSRWLPGLILMPQPNSFQPIQGTFQPGNDPRSASFVVCAEVLMILLESVANNLEEDPTLVARLNIFIRENRVPYEFPVSYVDASQVPLHRANNVFWCFNQDAEWLSHARTILKSAVGQELAAISQIGKTKLSVKVFKTDRALTGKDKTNRAKRWEVLYGDFQHASITECWSVERKLTEQLVMFDNFPPNILARFYQLRLVQNDVLNTRCPITLAPLDFVPFAAVIVAATHGRSDYQIGHMTPLKRGGKHVGGNVSWQSADGNRIQGDLTLQETKDLLAVIHQRTHLVNAVP
jgi:hypothetical protein